VTITSNFNWWKFSEEKKNPENETNETNETIETNETWPSMQLKWIDPSGGGGMGPASISTRH